MIFDDSIRAFGRCPIEPPAAVRTEGGRGIAEHQERAFRADPAVSSGAAGSTAYDLCTQAMSSRHVGAARHSEARRAEESPGEADCRRQLWRENQRRIPVR